jgi:hypothetical protein
VSHYALNHSQVPVLIIHTEQEAPERQSAGDVEEAGAAAVPGEALTAAT